MSTRDIPPNRSSCGSEPATRPAASPFPDGVAAVYAPDLPEVPLARKVAVAGYEGNASYIDPTGGVWDAPIYRNGRVALDQLTEVDPRAFETAEQYEAFVRAVRTQPFWAASQTQAPEHR